MKVVIELTQDVVTCLAVRRVVFMDEQGVSEADEIDQLDDECLHLLAWDEGSPVGTARIHVTDLGALLVRRAIEVFKGKAEMAKLGAQVHALGFYAAVGFVTVGSVYDDAGIDHRDMVLGL